MHGAFIPETTPSGMRWLLVLALVVLAACDVQQTPTSATVISSGDWVNEVPRDAESVPAKTPIVEVSEGSPNISKRGETRVLACVTFGCDANTQVIADKGSRYYYPCYCDAARKIAFEDIICLRSYAQAHERKFTLAPACS